MCIPLNTRASVDMFLHLIEEPPPSHFSPFVASPLSLLELSTINPALQHVCQQKIGNERRLGVSTIPMTEVEGATIHI